MRLIRGVEEFERAVVCCECSENKHLKSDIDFILLELEIDTVKEDITISTQIGNN